MTSLTNHAGKRTRCPDAAQAAHDAEKEFRRLLKRWWKSNGRTGATVGKCVRTRARSL